MNKKTLKNNKGISVIEVLISLAMAAIIITAIGGSLSSIHKLNTASATKEKALAYAKQSIEIVSDIKEKPDCCLNSSIYDSIWEAYPDTSGLPPLKLVDLVSGQWQLQPGSDTIDNYTREITIQNLSGDPNRKEVKVTVTWPASTQGISLSTIFTNWKNL